MSESTAPRRFCVGSFWRGETALWVSFWLIWLLPTALSSFALSVWTDKDFFSPRKFFFLVLAALAASVYSCVGTVGVWRSAGRYDGPAVWRRLARGAAVAYVAIWVATAILTGIDGIRTAPTEAARRSIALLPPPKYMSRVVVAWTAVNVPHAPAAERPRTYTRAEDRFCRLEMEIDPVSNTQSISIMNEPHWWLIEGVSKTAQHTLDPQLPFTCQLPLFQDKKIVELEIGHELEFFRAHRAAVSGSIETGRTFTVALGEANLSLTTRKGSDVPAVVEAVYAGNREERVRYLDWRERLPFDPSVFAPPPGTTVKQNWPSVQFSP